FVIRSGDLAVDDPPQPLVPWPGSRHGIEDAVNDLALDMGRQRLQIAPRRGTPQIDRFYRLFHASTLTHSSRVGQGRQAARAAMAMSTSLRASTSAASRPAFCSGAMFTRTPSFSHPGPPGQPSDHADPA